MDQIKSLPQHALQIGITGGIGSGKTTICKIFEKLGIPVYYADERAKAIMVENPFVMEQVIDLLGRDSYFPDGSLNRTYIAGIVFNDAQKLEGLNGIVHPAVGEDGRAWHAKQIGIPYTLREAALMIESGNHKFMDKLILVVAPKELRIERVVKRDNVSRESVLARMDRQMPEEDKIGFANYIIVNDGHSSLIKQVWAIHQKLMAEIASDA